MYHDIYNLERVVFLTAVDVSDSAYVMINNNDGLADPSIEYWLTKHLQRVQRVIA